MDAPSGNFPEEAGPPVPPGTAEDLFQQAEEVRHRGVWEEAIRLYRFSLQKDPAKPQALHGLALSYEGKAREPGYESYLQAAMGEYRKMITLDPTSSKAHDGLLAAAAKIDALDALMEEYKARIARGGDVKPFQDGLRKIQAYLLLRASPAKQSVPPPPAIISFVFGVLAPGMAVLTLAIAFLIRLKGGASHNAPIIAQGLIKLSLGGFFSFAGYKIFLYWRVSRP